MSLQKVKIGSFLNRIKNTTTIEDSKLYKRITIRTKHQGISQRDEVKGLNIGTKAQFIVNTGQFLLSKIDARLGAFGIVPPELDNGIITGNFWAYEVDKKKVNIEWFNLFTSSGNFYDICNIASSGTTHRKYLDEKKFLNFEINIPTVQEQNAFLEKFKKQKINFNSLSTELQNQSDLIKKLRQSILQDGVQGKLSLPDASRKYKGEDAQQLLQKIKTEKQILISEGKLKKEKELPPISPEEIPFELPKGWAWCRLGEICLLITDGTHQTPKYVEKGRPFLSALNIKPFKFMPDIHKFVSEEDYQGYIKSRKAELGDVLLTRVGAGIGEAAVINQKIDFAFYVSLGLLKPSKGIYNKYLELFLNSPLGRNRSFDNTLGRGVSAGNLNLSLIRNFTFPLPPISEQKIIVSKVEELMQSCDILEKEIEYSKTQLQHLMQNVLREAFEGKEVDREN